jgi:uncharacterized phiE125 gp8 family phage protein
MNTTILTAPTKVPITLENVKGIIGLESDQKQFDNIIDDLILAAVDYFQQETNTVIMKQTWYGHIEDWPLEDDYIEILLPPLKSVASIKYTTSAGTEVEWANTEYSVDINVKPGRVFLGYLKNWPTAILTPASNAIKVEFICGYDNQDNVPQDIKVALKLLTEHWFTNRGEANTIPKAVESTIFKHKMWTL